MQDIIPMVLDESMVEYLTDEVLDKLASCSTDLVKTYILSYLDSENKDPKIADRISAAYNRYISLNDFLGDEATADAVSKIQYLRPSSIMEGMSVEELCTKRDAIKHVLNNKYAVPYIEPVTITAYSQFKEAVSELAKDTNNVKVKEFAKNVVKYNTLFKDERKTGSRGTIVKSIMKRSQDYEVMLKGIDFLLEVKAKRRNPDSWRYL